MEKMHVDEMEIDEALVRRLLVAQFPHWAELPLGRIEPAGTVPWRSSSACCASMGWPADLASWRS
ncbi:hypothetical protein [Aneurinibacillus sp. REN35]|uniref:hypothetical protein n=1 Tax=Aneurinibacillus sp. REN35 TaxID=3237286 RepID=UPI0035297C66